MFPQDSRSFQHIVPDVKSLLFLIAFDLMMETKIIESNEADIKLQNNLYILHKLINNGEIHLECSCSIVMSCIRYLEIQKYNSLITNNKLKEYIDKLLEIVRVKDNHYDSLLLKADRLIPYLEGLTFEDIFGLVHAEYLNEGIILNNNKNQLKQWVDNNKEYIESSYCDIQIHYIYSLVKFIQEQDLFSDLLNNRNIIIVNTPDNDPIELPSGSTTINFAYKLHSSIGHRFSKAEINGKEVPINTVIHDQDNVKIITKNTENPDLHWLNHIKTDYAAKQIKKWHKKFNIERGEKLLKKEFGKRYSTNGEVLNYVAIYLRQKTTLELLEQLGKGDINLEQVKQIITEYISIKEKRIQLNEIKSCNRKNCKPIKGKQYDNYQIARCCSPFPGDEVDIIGIVKKHHNSPYLKIHNIDCESIKNIPDEEKIAIEWNCSFSTVSIKLIMKDKEEMLRATLNEIASQCYKYNVRKSNPSNSYAKLSEAIAIIMIDVLINSTIELKHLVNQIRKTPGILNVDVKGIYPGITKYCQH